MRTKSAGNGDHRCSIAEQMFYSSRDWMLFTEFWVSVAAHGKKQHHTIGFDAAYTESAWDWCLYLISNSIILLHRFHHHWIISIHVLSFATHAAPRVCVLAGAKAQCTLDIWPVYCINTETGSCAFRLHPPPGHYCTSYVNLAEFS